MRNYQQCENAYSSFTCHVNDIIVESGIGVKELLGDRPSGTSSMLALRHTAEMSSNVKVTEMACKNSYVDDILQSVDSADEAESLITEVEETFKLGGFRVKHWIISGRGEKDRFNINIIHSSLEKGSWVVLETRH